MFLEFLTASKVVRAVLRIAQLLFLFLLFSTFSINDVVPLFTMHMIYTCNNIAIFKAGVQMTSVWAWFLGKGGVKKVRFELKI